MLRDIPTKIKIKGHEILITPSGSYTCDAFCKSEEAFCISERFTDAEKFANDMQYLKNYDKGVISYRDIMWNCWERLEVKLRSLKVNKAK